MGLKALVTCCLTVGICSMVSAQQSKITFRTEPANAKLIFDGEEVGDANGRKVKVGFNARKGIVQHVFIVKAAGYNDAEITFNEDMPAQKLSVVKLERSLPTFDFETPFLMDFDQIQSGIAYSSNVGSNTKWKYKFDEEITIGEKRLKILDAMERMQMPTLRQAGADAPPVARIQVKGIVDGLDIKRGRALDNFSPYSKYNTIKTTIRWQFYDRETKEVFLEESNEAAYEFTNSEVNVEFFNAIVENFLVMFNVKPSVEKEINAYDMKLVTAAEMAKEAAKKAELALRQAALDSLATSQNMEAISSAVEIDSAKAIAMAVQPVRIARPGIREIKNPLDLESSTKRAVVTIQVADDKTIYGGTVISSDGYIVTAELDSNATAVKVQFSNGIILDGTVEARSTTYGIALVKVEANGLYALPIIEDMGTVNGKDEVISWESADIHTLDAKPAHGSLLGKKDPRGVRSLLTNIGNERVSHGAALIDADGRIIGVIDIDSMEGALSQTAVAIDARYIRLVLGIEYE